MPDTPTPAEPSPEWLKLMAGLILSGSFIAREEREKIAAALSRLAQVEQERDASDAKTLEEAAQLCNRLAAAVKVGGNCGESLGGLILRQEIARQPYERCAAEIRRAAIERHKRSRQQRA
jgi:hypothetical protein